MVWVGSQTMNKTMNKTMIHKPWAKPLTLNQGLTLSTIRSSFDFWIRKFKLHLWYSDFCQPLGEGFDEKSMRWCFCRFPKPGIITSWVTSLHGEIVLVLSFVKSTPMVKLFVFIYILWNWTCMVKLHDSPATINGQWTPFLLTPHSVQRPVHTRCRLQWLW